MPFHLPLALLICHEKVLWWWQTNRTCHSVGIVLTAPAALCNCGPVRVGCGLRQQQQPLQLTAYTSAHSTAPGSTCSMEAGVEEEGTTCSVVQPHLQRPVDGQRMCPPGNTRGCGLMSARARG